jgi:hypothetical protein
MREAGIEKGPVADGAAPPQPEVTDITDFRNRVRMCAAFLVEHLNYVDAIIAPDDATATCITSACRLCGRRPGKDIFITGDTWHSAPEREWTDAHPSMTVRNN